jgi:hypothetical protein
MKTLAFIYLVLSLIFGYNQVNGQINLKKIAKSKINNRAQQRTGQAVDKGLNEIEGIFKKNSESTDSKEEKNEK